MIASTMPTAPLLLVPAACLFAAAFLMFTGGDPEGPGVGWACVIFGSFFFVAAWAVDS